MDIKKNDLFEKMSPGKALAIMALPTIASQMIILIYNLADTWFIGRTDDSNKVGASALALSVYMIVTALANVFGVGGGSLMVRLVGEKKTDDARKVASYTLAVSFISAVVLSILVLIFMDPLLRLLGASDYTLLYGKQYVLMTTVIGGVPTLLSMCMPQLLRNAGYSKESGIGVALGSLLNIALDPLFMFVILPEGYEVLGAGLATMISSYISMFYFIMVFRRVKNDTVLVIPRKLEKIDRTYMRSMYSVGIPAAVAIFLFDLVTIVINRLTVGYGVDPLAAMGIVLKVERIPINIGLGICLGMVPLISYNYGARNFERMRAVFKLSRNAVMIFSCVCVVIFWIMAEPIVSCFMKSEGTVAYGVEFLRGRCFALPFMMAGYLIVNYMNAVNRGPVSFILAIIRHVVLIIPVLLIMNALLHMSGLIWSQLVADVINTFVAAAFFFKVQSEIRDSIQVVE